MPNLVDWNNCCGCGACASKCPKNAIGMQSNQEGFLHPVIDSCLCIECGSCEKVCPGLSPSTTGNNNPKAFMAALLPPLLKKSLGEVVRYSEL